MSDSDQSPAPEELLAEFLINGTPVDEHVTRQLERMSQEDRSALVDVVLSLVETDGSEDDGVQKRADWVHRLRGRSPGPMLELMSKKDPIHVGFIPAGGRHSNPVKGKFKAGHN